MATTNRPIRQRRLTAQRGKRMSQSQRWGKVVITMPVPQGDITTSEILIPDALEEAIKEADAEVGVVELEIEDEK